ncbi:MAG: hypothetical protein K940chlam3_01437 [Chlamydiae bacterium]|nr:hypothetical protein [Chlamydiota bacterium]
MNTELQHLIDEIDEIEEIDEEVGLPIYPGQNRSSDCWGRNWTVTDVTGICLIGSGALPFFIGIAYLISLASGVALSELVFSNTCFTDKDCTPVYQYAFTPFFGFPGFAAVFLGCALVVECGKKYLKQGQA